jgi:hypothetical protein
MPQLSILQQADVLETKTINNFERLEKSMIQLRMCIQNKIKGIS